MHLHEALAPYCSTYSTAFLRAVEFTLGWETEFQSGHYGDYAHVRTENDPSDPGGTTRYGIDQRSHPKVDVKSLILPDALRIYHDDEWSGIRGDELPESIGLIVFDAAVNVGTSKSAKWLQKAVGFTGDDVDGNIGPMTINAVKNHAGSLSEPLLQTRENYYHDIAKGRLSKYLKGWLARVQALRDYLSE